MGVEVTLKKWGNSLAVRLPKEIIHNTDLHENSLIELNVVKGNIVATPVKEKITLDSLLEGITPENYGKVIDFGNPVGNEVW